MWMRIKMKKFFVALLFVLSTVAFSKTWEAETRFCDEVTSGFWFPNHNWTDKGEPWIKPLMFGEFLNEYEDYGISFNYYYSYYCFACDYVNPFNIRYLPPSSTAENEILMEDSVYFFSGCELDSYGHPVNEKDFSIGNLSIDDFKLVTEFEIDPEFPGFDEPSGFSLESFYVFCPQWREMGIYFIYKKYSDKFEYNALCHYVFAYGLYGYGIQCEFQDDGSLNFDKQPDATGISDDYCAALESLKLKSNLLAKKKSRSNAVLYKINGTPATKNSSNIVIQNKQPVLQLKGR